VIYSFASCKTENSIETTDLKKYKNNQEIPAFAGMTIKLL